MESDLLPATDGLFLGETITPRRWDGSKLINLPTKFNILYVDDTNTTVANTNVGTTVFSFQLPANTLNLNNYLYLVTMLQVTSRGTSGTLSHKVYVGGTLIGTNSIATLIRSSYGRSCWLEDATNGFCYCPGFFGYGLTTSTATIDMTVAQTITVTLTWNVTDASAIAQKFYVILHDY